MIAVIALVMNAGGSMIDPAGDREISQHEAYDQGDVGEHQDDRGVNAGNHADEAKTAQRGDHLIAPMSDIVRPCRVVRGAPR